mmetsp:Transcript_59835/g.140894  ORF Transcript_59835/g.140894 Transcript_59835/m.140894 type:complete len:327 (-) Transcript_59835:368-1348(-)
MTLPSKSACADPFSPTPAHLFIEMWLLLYTPPAWPTSTTPLPAPFRIVFPTITGWAVSRTPMPAIFVPVTVFLKNDPLERSCTTMPLPSLPWIVFSLKVALLSSPAWTPLTWLPSTLLCEHMTAVSSMRRKPHPFVSLSTLFEISAVLFPHATIPASNESYSRFPSNFPLESPANLTQASRHVWILLLVIFGAASFLTTIPQTQSLTSQSTMLGVELPQMNTPRPPPPLTMQLDSAALLSPSTTTQLNDNRACFWSSAEVAGSEEEGGGGLGVSNINPETLTPLLEMRSSDPPADGANAHNMWTFASSFARNVTPSATISSGSGSS